MPKIEETSTQQVITKCDIPGIDYVINPYVGCEHSCVYCYARFMKRFTGHTEPWGEFVDIKSNAADTIPTKSEKYRGRTLLLSSVTDPYQPLEKECKLTRQILKKLIPLQPNLQILTKSDLITRDIDLLKQFKQVEVGLTITMLDEKIRKEIEPNAKPSAKRIEALKELHKAGLKTYVFVGPIMPYLTDWKEIIRQTKDYADSYLIDKLNIKGTIGASINKWLKTHHPDLLAKYAEIYTDQSDYWQHEKKEIEIFCKTKKIDCSSIL
ncbi:radical SAM protein [Patescibacteria group bacterium]